MSAVLSEEKPQSPATAKALPSQAKAPPPVPPKDQPKTPAAPPPAGGSNSGLAASLEAWRHRLEGAGIPCRAVALHGDDAAICQDFPKHDARWNATWPQVRQRVSPTEPVALCRAGPRPSSAALSARTATSTRRVASRGAQALPAR